MCMQIGLIIAALCLPERPQIIMVSALDKNSYITYDNVQQLESYEKQGRAPCTTCVGRMQCDSNAL